MAPNFGALDFQRQIDIGKVFSSISKPRSSAMKNDEIKKVLLDDIDHIRLKAQYYKSLHLFEAENYAEKLASNIELALTTMPSDDDTEIY
jgi:hypothetical protein